jgi:hypothetical protein
MGHELYRMIRDGAPATWTGPMVHVAQAIADDARDPPHDPDGSEDGWPWSKIPLQGHWDRRGRWRDGLAERTRMSPRAISRALTELARAGYEMRVPIGTSKQGKPVFAANGHAMSFVVPPLEPRPKPQRSPSTAAFKSKARQGRRASGAKARQGRRPLPLSKTFPSEELSPQVLNGGVVNSPVEGGGCRGEEASPDLGSEDERPGRRGDQHWRDPRARAAAQAAEARAAREAAP